MKTSAVLTETQEDYLAHENMKQLADRIVGLESGKVVEGVCSRQSVTIKLSSELVSKIDSYAKRAKTTRTNIVETMLWVGVAEMNQLDGTCAQLQFDSMIEYEEKTKKGTKK